MIGREELPRLLPHVAAGDVESFTRLYDLYSSTLYSLLLRILRDPSDAQEALQESFLQVWRRASGFDPARGSEAAFLISIARSRGIDRLRSRNVRSEREHDAAKEGLITFPSVDETGLDAAILSEERKAVRAALSELPEPQRLALELAYFEGLSQSEIATKLNEPLGTVKTRIQLGMKKMKERLRTVR